MSFRLLLLAMVLPFFSCGSDKAPEGSLIYCSYSRSGSAGLGKEYCELIADPGSEPKVVVALNIGNRFGDPEINEEFPVEAAVAESLRESLEKMKAYKLDGYEVDEPITGGYGHRIYLEYSSGEKITARWYGHNIKDSAIAAYNFIERFFAPWREKAIEKNRLIVSCSFIVKNPGGAGTDAYQLFCQPNYSPLASVNLHVDNTRSVEEVHKEFDLDPDTLNEFRRELNEMQVKKLGDRETGGEPARRDTVYELELQYDRDQTQRLRWLSRDESPKFKAIRECIISFFSSLRD